jgi:hypothetical protein
MGRGSIQQWKSLERSSPTLFLLGGGLIIGHAAVNGIEAFSEMAAPTDVFGPAGYLLAVVGLWGLYPVLVDRAPKLARVAGAVAAVSLTGWVVITISTLGEVAGVLSSGSEFLPGAFFLTHITSVMLTYVLFGAASLRAGVRSRTVGILLLMPPLLIAGMLAGATVFGNSAVGSFVIGSAQAIVHLSIGATLRAGASNDVDSLAGDATAG